jgi:hypothetical protein
MCHRFAVDPVRKTAVDDHRGAAAMPSSARSARFAHRSLLWVAALSALGACESAEERSNEVFIVDYAPQSIETRTVCDGVETRTLDTWSFGRGGRVEEHLTETFDAEDAPVSAHRRTYGHDALGRIIRIEHWVAVANAAGSGRRWHLAAETGRAWFEDAVVSEREVRYSLAEDGSDPTHGVEHVRTYTRDAKGHLEAIEHEIHDTEGRRTSTSTVETDAAGRLTRLVGDDLEISWVRDDRGRVIRETTTPADGPGAVVESYTYTQDYVTTWRRACEAVEGEAGEDCGWQETYTCTPTVDAQGMLTAATCTGQDRAGCAVTRTQTCTRDGRSASIDLAPDGWPTHRTETLLRDAADL